METLQTSYPINKSNMKSILLAFIISICTVLAPTKVFIATVAAFIAIDTILAIHASIKFSGFKSIRSHKFFNIFVKSFYYFGAIILGFLIDKYILEGALMGINLLITKGVSLIVIANELKSIDETQKKLTNKSLWIYLSEFFAKAKSIKKDLNNVIDEDKVD